MSPSPIPIVLIGAGQRGARAYASYALRRPEEIRVVAVAEPNDLRRTQIATAHNIPQKRCFRSWEDLLDAPLLGDAALICTPDELHFGVSRHAMEAGYHVMLETPIAPNPKECLALLDTANHTHQHLIIGHGLRYTAFYRALHDIIVSGRLGQILSYKHDRAIAFWHTAHQFIRSPHWQSEQNPMLFLEGLHELDLVLWLLNEGVETITSVGAKRHFHINNAPISNVPLRCIEDCPIEAECPFSAIGLYLEKRFRGLPQKGYPYSALAEGDESSNALVKAVESERWGLCVYHSDMNLIDHQSILMQSASGVSISLTLNGHSLQEGRVIKIDGTHGALTAEFIGLDSHITFYDHATHKENKINFRIGPHGDGGDHGLMGNLAKMLRGEAESLTLASATLDAHLLAFAIEEARLDDKVIKYPTYKRRQINRK